MDFGWDESFGCGPLELFQIRHGVMWGVRSCTTTTRLRNSPASPRSKRNVVCGHLLFVCSTHLPAAAPWTLHYPHLPIAVQNTDTIHGVICFCYVRILVSSDVFGPIFYVLLLASTTYLEAASRSL